MENKVIKVILDLCECPLEKKSYMYCLKDIPTNYIC